MRMRSTAEVYRGRDFIACDVVEFPPAISGLPADTNHPVDIVWKEGEIGNRDPNLAAPRQIAKDLVKIALAHRAVP